MVRKPETLKNLKPSKTWNPQKLGTYSNFHGLLMIFKLLQDFYWFPTLDFEGFRFFIVFIAFSIILQVFEIEVGNPLMPHLIYTVQAVTHTFLQKLQKPYLHHFWNEIQVSRPQEVSPGRISTLRIRCWGQKIANSWTQRRNIGETKFRKTVLFLINFLISII